ALMMRLSRTVLLLAFALAAGARAAAAQTIPSPYDYLEQTQGAGVFAGYLFADPDLSLTDSTSLPIAPASGPVFGLRYQVRAAGPLYIEGSVGVSPTDRRLFAPRTDADSAGGRDLGATVPATLVMGDVALRFFVTGPRTWNGLAPFVVGTGGLAGDVRGSFDEEEEIAPEARFRFGPAFAVGAGLGTDWYPVPRASLRFEVMGRLRRMRTPGGFLPTARDARSEWNPAVGITLGGALHF
ncbi:MAG: hypothetical protein KY467_03730, partial [Gemmatimonadetes bacterium]|nr:hypothetical protein [Gemmatimonadota bacterium]